MLSVERSLVSNGDGWLLALRRTSLSAPVEGGRPLLIVPGYGMNSFIFGFHPRGLSLEEYLATRGREVWSVDLRAQGDSVCENGMRSFGLRELALTDVRAALDAVLARTATGADRVDVMGCSLGATLMFARAAIGRDERMGALISLAGPLRWERVHPAVRFALASPELAARVSFRGTRRLAGIALPWLSRMPRLLGFYINGDVTDLSRAAEMVRTVEDPVPAINREIAEWIRDRDLTLAGENLTRAVGRLRNPLLCVVANADGVVPRETALSPYHAIGSERRDVLEVGGAAMPIAHADLFLCNEAERLVFAPVADWLEDVQAGRY